MRKTEKVFLAIAFKICNLTEPENFPKSFKFELGWKKVRRICRFILLPFILSCLSRLYLDFDLFFREGIILTFATIAKNFNFRKKDGRISIDTKISIC